MSPSLSKQSGDLHHNGGISLGSSAGLLKALLDYTRSWPGDRGEVGARCEVQSFFSRGNFSCWGQGSSSFIADDKAAVRGRPGEGAFHYLSVPRQLLATFNTTVRYASDDASLLASPPSAKIVVAFVGVQLEKA